MKYFITSQPTTLMRQSLALFIEKKSFRQVYQTTKLDRLAAADAPHLQHQATSSFSQASSANSAVPPSGAATSGPVKKGRKKKDMKKVSQLSPQELEKRALEELEVLRLKKRAIFTRIRERKERKMAAERAAL